MYNSQYYTCEQIDERLLQGYLDDYNTQTGQNLTKEQFLTKLGNIFAKETVIDNTAVNIRYFVCDTAAGTAAKIITAAGYALFQGGSIKVKFLNRNTAGSATLNINSQGVKTLYYGGKPVSASNSWDNGEVVEIYYDGTNYYANNIEGNFRDGIFDISAYNLTEGQPTKYTTLAEALGTNGNNVPPIFRKGGMQIKYVSTSDNKYVQFRYMGTDVTTAATFTNAANWQGVDDEPLSGSTDISKSGGIDKRISKIESEVNKYTFKHTYKVGQNISTGIIFGFNFKPGATYDFKVTNMPTLSTPLYFYINEDGSRFERKGEVNTDGNAKSFTNGGIGFGLYAESDNTTERTIEMTISERNNLVSRIEKLEDYDNIPTNASPKYVKSWGVYNALTLPDSGGFITKDNYQNNNALVSKKVVFNEVNDLAKDLHPVEFKFKFPSGSYYSSGVCKFELVPNRLYYLTLTNTSVSSAYFYLEFSDGTHSNYFSLSNGVERELRFNAIENKTVIGFSLYSGATLNADEYATLLIKTHTGVLYKEVERLSDVVSQDEVNIGCFFKGTIPFILTGSNIPTLRPVNIKANTKFRILTHSDDGAIGSAIIYFFDKYLNNVFDPIAYTINGNNSLKLPSVDIAYIAFYIPSERIEVEGTFELELIPAEGENLTKTLSSAVEKINGLTVDSDILYSRQEKVLKGYGQYIFETVVDAPCEPGEEIWALMDSVTGWSGGFNMLIEFFNGNTSIEVNYFKGSWMYQAPANTTKVQVRLYPYANATTAANITAVYKNIRIIRGNKPKAYADITFNGIEKPKDYYFENNYLQNKVAHINELLDANAAYGDAFFFTTDIHWYENAKNSPALINYISDKTGIVKMFCGGDYTDGNTNEKKYLTMLNRYWRMLKNDMEITYVIGNHEYLNETTASNICRNIISNKADKHIGNNERKYFYYDDNLRNIRYIVLASFDESEKVKTGSGSTGATEGFEQTQLNWLENIALANVGNKDVIIFTHRFYEINQNSDVIHHRKAELENIIDTAKNTGLHILCICGHTHRDRVVNTNGGVPMVATTCDKNTPWRQSTEDRWDIDVDRTSGTIREQAFDVMIVNTNTHTLTAVRIGGKARDGVGNNPGNEVEERTITY